MQMLRLSVGLPLLLVACVPQSAPPAVPTTQIHVGEVPRLAGVETEPTRRSVGDAVEVEWQGSWYAAVIREQRGAQWLIHYDGYGDEWDEVVGDERIRVPQSAVEPPSEQSSEPAEDDGADP
ncbi:MAG TPA: hypothetical protein VIF62_21840 [Labilithrix sp.]|jgi:hypothetical protein